MNNWVLAFLSAFVCGLSACNKMPTKSGEVSDVDHADSERTESSPPVAVTGSNLVDLKNGVLGLEVEYFQTLEATVVVKWFVKRAETQGAPLKFFEADGFAKDVSLNGPYDVQVNGEDISSKCVRGQNHQALRCEHIKVNSPVIHAAVTAKLIHHLSKAQNLYEAHTPYLTSISPGNLLASGGTLTLEGNGLMAEDLEIILFQGGKSSACENVKKISDTLLTCQQPEVTNMSGAIDVRISSRGQSFIYRSAYFIQSNDLFLNTNCEQAIANIVTSGSISPWSSPSIELPNTLPTNSGGAKIIPSLTVNGASTIRFSSTEQGIIHDAETLAQWCIANSSGGRNSGVFSINSDGTYSQDIPLFCGKQLVYLIPKNGARTSIGIYEVERANCSAKELITTLSWGSDANDLELHLIRSGGMLNNIDFRGGDCMWSNCMSQSPDWGNLGDNSDNPRKNIDWVGSNGTENIVLPKPESTSYDIYVEYWGNGQTTDARVTINAFGTAASIALVDVAFDSGNGTFVKGSSLAPHNVWWVGRVNLTGTSPVIKLNQKVGTAEHSSVLFDCSPQWSGGCKASVTPSTISDPVVP